jgi:putative acyl-CoA dehydrogenase
MGALTRLDCALGTAGLMRQAFALVLRHACERKAFGRALVDQPLMRNVLADLALESEAATALALRLARAVDCSENRADDHEAAMRRLLTPVAKFWICKRGSHFAQEAMECLGGNGYVEEHGRGTMARIYREMPLNSIWEGAGNIMALDLMRVLRKGPVLDALMHELKPVRGAHAALDAATDALAARLDGAVDEAQARGLVRDLALVIQGALLRQHANDAVFDAFCRARLEASADVFGLLPSGVDVDAILKRAAQ